LNCSNSELVNTLFPSASIDWNNLAAYSLATYCYSACVIRIERLEENRAASPKIMIFISNYYTYLKLIFKFLKILPNLTIQSKLYSNLNLLKINLNKILFIKYPFLINLLNIFPNFFFELIVSK
jgi:hypothetical protein